MRQPYLLNQVEFCHVLHDPMAFWMDSFLQGVPNIATFDMQSNCSSKYKMHIRFMLQKLHAFHISSLIYKQEDHFVRKMLTWLH
jgi:hypothetical protein